MFLTGANAAVSTRVAVLRAGGASEVAVTALQTKAHNDAVSGGIRED